MSTLASLVAEAHDRTNAALGELNHVDMSRMPDVVVINLLEAQRRLDDAGRVLAVVKPR